MQRSLRIRSHARAILAVAILAFATVSSLYGHTVGISRGEYRMLGDGVAVELVFARPELAAAVPGLDADDDGTVSQAEVASGRAAIERVFVQGLEVRVPAGSCTGVLQNFVLTEEDGASIRAAYRCAAEPAAVTFDLKFLSVLSHGHRHLAAAMDGFAVTHEVAYQGAAAMRFAVSRDGAVVNPATGVAWPMFRLGIQHILTGYDHLVFLLGLILVANRFRSLLVVITAFTVAHSITLGLATLQVWTPSGDFVEPAIALSIAYIGVENWFVRDASRRWLITFPFGLVHGFGFSGALRQIALPRAEIPVALLSFNAGVEAGQLAVLAVVLPIIFWLRRRPWFVDPGVKGISAVIAVAGLWWFLLRVGLV